MKILNCFAHLDDAEIWVGGTLLKHSRKGDNIYTITFSKKNDKRIEESKMSHLQLHSQLIVLPYNLNETEKITNNIFSIISSIMPDVILTHWNNDCHPDHRDVFNLCSRAIVKSWIKTSFPRALYSVDTYCSQGINSVFIPTHYIDISDVWDEKLKLISYFESQPKEIWMEMVLIQNSFYGNRVNKKFAEGLKQIPIQGKLTSCEYLPGG